MPDAQASLITSRDLLRAAIAALVPDGTERRYPSALRAKIARYAAARLDQGASRAQVSAELGVSSPTLKRMVAAPSPRLRLVRVTEGSKTPVPAVRLVVRGPAGVTIEGLDVAGVAALLLALT